MENGVDNQGQQPPTYPSGPLGDVPPGNLPPANFPPAPTQGAPKTSLVFPIIATVLFWPVGLFGILKTVSARKALAVADYATATQDARSAKTLSIIATCVGALGWLLSIILVIVTLGIATTLATPDEPTPTYSEVSADGPTNEIVFTLTVDEGTATHDFTGILGGTDFENYDLPDSEFESSLTKTILIDKDSEDFTVNVSSATPGATVSCEFTVDGELQTKQTAVDSTYCSFYTEIEGDAKPTETPAATPSESPTSSAFTAPSFAVGDCLTTVTTNAGTSSTKADCAGAHDGQVTHVETLPEGDYPGDEALTAQADSICSGDAFTNFVGVPFAYSDLAGSYMYPKALNWMMGDREITCLVHVAEGQTTGSLQNAGH
ncbi:CD225/dispanin family protein [Lysinibacter cavernae]|uniref:Septum formation-related domain-containing protein n=1 Tax=Lysinibacter cavernae TaxID=1640652 RepID=A0A7X5TUK3_9MICO|nr:CD225/dispanin family protein [Lysinibacter cavernae]NIH53662.1 hypothetical protein [Lysinibacter cavernae]